MSKNRVSANLNMLYTNLPLLQRYAAAASAGFQYVEVSIPYSEPAAKLREAADSNNLKHTLINAPPGNWDQGFRGIASLQSESVNFEKTIDVAIEYAKTLDCPRVHLMAGIPRTESDIQNAKQTYVENVRIAAEKLAKENLMCLLEPINKYSIDGYFLNNYDLALEVVQAVNRPNLKIQYDLFHAQQISGQLIPTMKRLANHIGYIQVAQVPNRGDCATAGEINYQYVFDQLNSVNNTWIIGAEYLDTDPHFDWVSGMGLSF